MSARTLGLPALERYAFVSNDGSISIARSSRLLPPSSALDSWMTCVSDSYIPQIDLDNADVHVGEMPWYAPGWAAGITRGNDIYFRDPQQTFCTPRDVALLGHELVHVGQYRDGMTWLGYLLASKKGYENNPYEVSAYEMQRKIQMELQPKDCSCVK
uniref:eCIS core domain-containing protein n=2 Tax=Ralstonia solanacearum TaxID=305 RepID=D8P2Z8_RALSL|nr:protein of unknown function [Ralstonia solanacearum CFBP2957]